MIDFNLYLITDRHQTKGRSLEMVLEEALKGGVRAIQLREKDLSSRQLYQTGLLFRGLTKKYKAQLYINDRFDIALAVRADGVHLGVRSIPVAVVRSVVGNRLCIGVSTHNMEEALEAVKGGTDFITFGPVYETPSKKKYGPPVGLDELRTVSQTVDIPVFGLGGIDSSHEKIHAVKSAGAHGVSMISAIIGAPDVQESTEKILKALESEL